MTQRCSIHRQKLVQQCPHCDATQTNDSSHAELYECSQCFQSLAISKVDGTFAPKPAFGEAQAEHLIKNIGSLGKTAVLPLQRFLASIDADLNRVSEELGDIFHNRSVPARPQLASLIAIAVYFDIDVVDLITAPEKAATQAGFSFKKNLPLKQERPFSLRRKERSKWFEKRLRDILSGPGPYPSTKAFCRECDFSLDGARKSFSELTKQLSAKHVEWKKQQASILRRRAIASIRRLHEQRRYMTDREFVRRVAQNSGAPIHVVRKLVQIGSSLY
ncbi:hypothetical protein ACFONN_14875 [Dyella humi]|uniref:Uncharacterized protein n=1 Tax=Dyella humi TaxID=1770547 RepID=A0ABW8IM58_9GAMM